MNSSALETIKSKLVQLYRTQENTQAGLFMLTEQVKTVNARITELESVKTLLEQPLPVPTGKPMMGVIGKDE